MTTKNTADSQPKQPAKFRNRDDAENKVCKAFTALGELAGVDVECGKGPDDLNATLIEAAQQCYYQDPHFLGGPACFNYAETTDQVDAIARKAAVVTQGFTSYIRERGDPKSLHQAEAHIAVIDAAVAWLRKTR
jgi:hypothetical protein